MSQKGYRGGVAGTSGLEYVGGRWTSKGGNGSAGETRTSAGGGGAGGNAGYAGKVRIEYVTNNGSLTQSPTPITVTASSYGTFYTGGGDEGHAHGIHGAL